MSEYGLGDLSQVTTDVADIIRAPRRISVVEAAEKYVRINDKTYSGPWDASLVPYMVEPMNLIKSRQHRAVVLVGPARSGKTQGLIDCWIAHSVVADPGDTAIYFPNRNLAYDFRKRRISRLHSNSPEIRKKISPHRYDTTLEMVIYRNGMILNIGWPTSSQVAQRDLRYVAVTDYDSIDDDIDGEGSMFELVSKRVQVAGSAGMCVIESSPKRPIIGDQDAVGHEAPVVSGGILPIYNRGDQRLWYWQCIDGCGKWFPTPALPEYDEYSDPLEAGAHAYVRCPHCAVVYRPSDKTRLNDSANRTWVPRGMSRDRDGNLIGDRRPSNIASFWLRGCAAAYQGWESLVANYVSAQNDYKATHSESALVTTTNVDQGMPYRPEAIRESTQASDIRARSQHERYSRGSVPGDVRFLITTVDVQSYGFEVLVVGYGRDRERWVIDRYSLRYLSEETQEHLMPASYLEHWDILTTSVMDKTYTCVSGGELRSYRIGVDMGGRATKGGAVQVSSRAYDWWRNLRKIGKADRVYLVKGAEWSTGADVKITSSKTGPGDVRVLLIRSNTMKDALSGDIRRDSPGPGYIHFPAWIQDRHIDELFAEERSPTGKWEKKTKHKRNETWDLLYYADGIWLQERAGLINWQHPPPWAMTMDRNSEIDISDPGKARKSYLSSLRVQ